MWGFTLLLVLQEPWTYQRFFLVAFKLYTFGSRFTYKRWVRIFYQNLNFSFLGQVFQYFCWVLKHVDWGSQHIPIFLLGLKACLLRFASCPLYLSCVQDWRKDFPVEMSWILLYVSLNFPYLTVVFTTRQVLPTDGPNCRVPICSASPMHMESRPNEPNTIN